MENTPSIPSPAAAAPPTPDSVAPTPSPRFSPLKWSSYSPWVREFLLWSLPALLIGLALRAVVMAQLPYGIYHDDTGDLLTTPYSLLKFHEWEIHGKKTFLVPALYTLFALIRVPILVGAPIVQHLLGLGLILLVGALCRLWFSAWRVFIIPLTLIVAVNPFLLWFEHVLMAETPFVFCTVLVALAGTLYALRQSTGRFVFLCLALFFESGARPEGKLLFGFAFFLLVLLHARTWRRDWQRFALLLVVAVATHFLTRTGQAGLLLYTSVVRLTPTELKAAPGFDPYIAEIRDSLEKRKNSLTPFPRVADRRLVSAAVDKYVVDHNPKGERGHRTTNDLCMKLAAETCRRNFFKLPAYFYQKFRYTARGLPAGTFNREWIFDRQKTAFLGNHRVTSAIPKAITGREINGEADYVAFLNEKYQVVPWFEAYTNAWQAAVNSVRLPDEMRQLPQGLYPVPRLPILFLAGGAGLLLVMLRRGRLQKLHLAWGITLLAFFYTIILTANVRPRFRFALEPFWYLYALMILDCVLYWILPKRFFPTPPPDISLPEGAGAEPLPSR